MAEESSKAAAQAFGVIPNAYFDIIARVIPGLLLLIGINRVTGLNLVTVVASIFASEKVSESTTAWILIVGTTGYVLGHALSPVVRFLESRPGLLGKPDARTHYFLPPFWRSEKASKKSRTKLQKQYNTLRSTNPSAAALAIRIRAEYTMYGGFALCLAITILLDLLNRVWPLNAGRVRTWHFTHLGFFELAICIVGVPVMLYRHFHTWEHFRDTVEELLNPSTHTPPSTPSNSKPPSPQRPHTNPAKLQQNRHMDR